MTKYEAVRNRIAVGSDMDYVGVCPSSVLEGEPWDHRPSTLLPNAKSILVFGRRLISGSVQAKFRAAEERKVAAASAYNAHSAILSINHLCMKETYDIAQDLENTYGCFAMPLTNNVLQAVQPEGNYAPFFADPYKAGLPIDIFRAAVAAGIGEMGWNRRVLTPDAGPRVYLCAILTSLEFERYDAPYSGPRLCDPEKCGVCARMCPVHALSPDEAETREIAGRTCRVGKLDVNGCSAACFGFRKELNPRTLVTLESDRPTDGELAAALEKQFDRPGFQTLDHLPTYWCDHCLVYCPVGDWDEQFRARHLTKN